MDNPQNGPTEIGTAETAATPDQIEESACPLCRNATETLLRTARDLVYGSREEFRIVRCDACGHVFVNPRPGVEEMLRYYPEDYGPHHNHQRGAGPSGSGSNHHPWYLSRGVRLIPGIRQLYYWLTDSQDVLLPNRSDATDVPGCVLELGCSDGDYLIRLQGQGWQVMGIEPAAAPASRAVSRGLDVRCGVLRAGEFPDAIFDAVCAWHVIEHVHEPRDTVEELARITKPGGELLLSVPNHECWEPRLFGEYWYLYMPPLHLHHFGPRTLRLLLEATGFDIVDCSCQPNLSNVIGSIGLWLREKRLAPGLGERLLRYPDQPSLWGQLLLSLPAKVLAACGQGGRLTVRAKRRAGWNPQPADSQQDR